MDLFKKFKKLFTRKVNIDYHYINKEETIDLLILLRNNIEINFYEFDLLGLCSLTCLLYYEKKLISSLQYDHLHHIISGYSYLGTEYKRTSFLFPKRNIPLRIDWCNKVIKHIQNS